MICACNVGSKILKKVKFIEKLQGRQADLIDGKQMESKNITMMDLTQRNNRSGRYNPLTLLLL
jgi:hypothetical protein